MADEGLDSCEYMWEVQIAMQRLLSMLRQTQNSCSDIECSNVTRFPGARDSSLSSDFVMLCAMIAFLGLMYILRPRSLRRLSNENVKDRGDGHDSNGDSPGPPSTTN